MKAAVLGRPVAHSLSPVIHNAGYAAAGLTGWSYEAYDVGADELEGFVGRLDADWAGLSLTMPLKEVALRVAAEVSPLARALGAANTLVLRDGRRFAENTDAPGMVAALSAAGLTEAARVAVLGAGGTARAALAAARDLGARQVTVYARRPAAVADLTPVAAALGVPIRPAAWSAVTRCAEADLVVSTVPTGVADAAAGAHWRPGGVLFDVVYQPWPTALAAAAASGGATVVGGLDLLLAQAAGQFELFTGVPAPLDAMRAALRRAVPAPAAG